MLDDDKQELAAMKKDALEFVATLQAFVTVTDARLRGLEVQVTKVLAVLKQLQSR